MSAGVPAEGGEGQDFELNLAPIIDCFTVLITYMLVSASFITLDMLDVSVATTSDAPAEQQPQEPPMALSIELTQKFDLNVKLSGKKVDTLTFASKTDKEFDNERLIDALRKIKKKWSNITDVSVKAEPGVQYKYLVRLIENVKTEMPKVTLGE